MQDRIRPLPLNDRLVNRAAWNWLKRAKEHAPPHSLHLLTLAWYGLDNGAEGDWPKREKPTLEQQVGHLGGWKAAEVMSWLTTNPDGPEDQTEQEESLLISLKTAKTPLQAAGFVLSEIWSRQQAACPALR